MWLTLLCQITLYNPILYISVVSKILEFGLNVYYTEHVGSANGKCLWFTYSLPNGPIKRICQVVLLLKSSLKVFRLLLQLYIEVQDYLKTCYSPSLYARLLNPTIPEKVF